MNTEKKHTIIPSIIIAVAPALFLIFAGCENFFNDIAGEPYKIAFTSNRSGFNEIYVMNADGSEQTRLTFDSSANINNTYPNWWPDGTQIAFVKFNAPAYDIYIMDSDGTNTKKITNDGLEVRRSSWSPDGTRIVYYRVAASRLYIVNIENLSVSGPILPNNQADPSWSKKTGKIVCSQIFGVNEIVTMNPDGSGYLQLTSAGIDYVRPSWSPDGSQILFSGKAGGHNELFIMNADGTSVKQITNVLTGIADYPSMSPDGEKITFEWDGTGLAHIYVMEADGSNMRQLTFTGNNRQPVWSPE